MRGPKPQTPIRLTEAEMSMWEDSFIRLAMASTAESSAAH